MASFLLAFLASTAPVGCDDVEWSDILNAFRAQAAPEIADALADLAAAVLSGLSSVFTLGTSTTSSSG